MPPHPKLGSLRDTRATPNNKTRWPLAPCRHRKRAQRSVSPRPPLQCRMLNFPENRAEEPGQGGNSGQSPSGHFSLLSHPSNCEQVGAQPGCADPDPHKLCTSLPFLDGGTGEITAPIKLQCTGSPAVSLACSGLPGLEGTGLAVGGPETLGYSGP